ncbi:MAG: hypothetical protein LBQ00_03330 [Syntrophobacterales bacterium]|jgi:heterodisulfide reductase subunit C|nr:hypothetical protein [Syntrophobacterales bacterium]
MGFLRTWQKGIVLTSKAIWLCAIRETCTTRCPCKIDVANAIDALRIIARRENKVSEKDIKLFYDTVLALMKQYGRLFEMGTLMACNINQGHFLADAELSPKAMEKGKIGFFPKNINGISRVAKIFTRFQDKAKKRD